MEDKLTIEILGRDNICEMMVLVKLLNPNRKEDVLKERLINMLAHASYRCFGLHKDGNLIGLTGCWTSHRLYTGKHLELDNVIINNKYRSNGYGKKFITLVESWAKDNKYDAIGLNTYVANGRSHKFYFNRGFEILGFNFQKILQY